jgi:NADH:ubiquinone oxidoreductase subunit 6 (subunit J)
MQSDIGSQAEGFFVFKSIGDFMVQMVDVFIIVGAIATFFFLLWGGISWLTSGGDKAKTEEAQKRITGAVIGLAILMAVYVIYKIILQFFGLSDAIRLPG